MTIKIHDDEAQEFDEGKKSAPPDYFSRSMKLKLFSLVALLGLVLFMMNEARKPENWEWMGFERPVPAEIDPLENLDEEEAGFSVPQTQEVSENSSTTGQNDNSLPGDSSVDDRDELAVEISPDERFEFDMARIQFDEQPLQAEAAADFWRSTFNDSSRSERVLLFRLLRYVRNRKPVPEDMVAPFTEMIAGFSNERDRYHTRLLDNLSTLSDSAVQKPGLNRQYFESKELWEQQILPAMQNTVAGEDITMQQLQSAVSLQLTLDKMAYQAVNDRTSLNQPDEGLAWLRCWETAINPGAAEFEPVTHIELSGQASSFRGRSVSISGNVRSIRLARLRRNEIGLDRYYVLWILPDDTNLSPYCVYSLELPDGFPDVEEVTTELDEPVIVNGVFFKIRPYESAGNEILFSPMLLANSFELKPDAAVTTPLFEIGWPNRPTTVVGLIMMLLIAGYLAWRAYTVTQMIRRRPDSATRERINQSLDILSNDPDIKSDLENVKSLQKKDELQ